ncbi:class I tRNA ligase family protein [Priestia flexa]|nr:class I tRNA ligase family protein [Priestia flexa]
MVKKYEESMENMEFSVALSAVWQYVSRTNKYIDETKPWTLAKDEEKRNELASVMVHLAEAIRHTAVLLQPFLTRTPEKIFSQIGVKEDVLKSWESIETFNMLREGTKVEKGEPMFPRLDRDEEITFIKEKMLSSLPAQEEKKEEVQPEQSEEISLDDFLKVDLRVAEIIHAEPVKKADKLLKIQLDLGCEKRQVVSGIAKFYKPEELIGTVKSSVL